MVAASPQAAPETPPSGSDRKWADLVAWVGLISAVIATMMAIFTFPTTMSKVVAGLACGAVCGLLWQATRDYARGLLSRGMIGWISGAGILLLLLVAALLDGMPPAASGSSQTETPVRTEQSRSPKVTLSPSLAVDDHATPAAVDTDGAMFLDQLTPLDGADDWKFGPRVMLGKTYPRSLMAPDCGFMSDGLSYNLFRKYGRFQATIGLADDAETGASATFQLTADDREVYSSRRLKPGDTETVDVPLKGVFRLTFSVGSSCEDTARATWGDAKLVVDTP